MLALSLVFLFLALVAALFAFGFVTSTSSLAAQIALGAFVALFLTTAFLRARRPIELEG